MNPVDMPQASSSRRTHYPSAKDHTCLILPFTHATYTDPSPLLHTIYQVLAQSSLQSLTLIFSTPPPSQNTSPALPMHDLARAQHEQLYATLVRSPTAHWARFQGFLGTVYATMAAAQWSSGKVLMEVEVHYEGEQGDWAEKLDLAERRDLQVVGLQGQLCLWAYLS
jgi:hypothetical protein